MELINSIFSWVMLKRMHQMELFLKYPVEVQQELIDKLITTAQNTVFGKEHDFANIKNLKDFRDKVPIRNYEQLYPYIDRLLKGEQQVLWPSDVKWFAKNDLQKSNQIGRADETSQSRRGEVGKLGCLRHQPK